MITGSTFPHVLYLFSTAGVAQSYANTAAFTGAGWAVTWYDKNGSALGSQPTYAIVDLGSGRHVISFPNPAGVWVALATVPAGKSDPGAFGGEGTSYDEDSLAGLFLTSTGIPAAQSAADQDLGDVVDGDSWSSGTLNIPLGKITPFGIVFADLNDTDFTLTAGLKSTPADASVPIDAAFGGSVTTDGAFIVSWDTFPTAMALSATLTDKQWFLDVQIAETAAPNRVITTNRYALRVVWDRDIPAP